MILVPFRDRDLRLEAHSADRAITGMILFDLRMHRTGINDFFAGPGGEGSIALQRHTALRTVSWLVRLNSGTHRTKVWLGRWSWGSMNMSGVCALMPVVMVALDGLTLHWIVPLHL